MKKELVKFTLNGLERESVCESRTTLLDFIRHDLGATGTHAGCEHGLCGACTVKVDGQIIRSCLMFACQANDSVVETIEGMSDSEELSDLQKAFKKHHALQCGFCTPGFLMSADDLLKKNLNPTEAEVREYLSGNICRCTGYVGIIEAVLEVASLRMKSHGGEDA
jgi:2-furoyl-CoA dehydrogenase 2Fe-2S iron sulfur subunit